VKVVVTGGAGYVGAPVVEELQAASHEVTVLDSLLHEQVDVAELLRSRGVRLLVADVRDAAARREALENAEAVVHLAAIVGDPACARQPELSHAVNVEASSALVADAVALGVARFVFASTCSNYGRMADSTVPVDETTDLRPVSLYAEQKVAIERALFSGADDGLARSCLRFATVYGVADRMRFDLTVNQFTRDLWAERPLEIYGELFWRPYVHVRDAARAVTTVLGRAQGEVAGRVFNVGDSDENYRKRDLAELIVSRLGRGEVSYVQREEDPRDYKVSFARIREELGYVPSHRVSDGIDEIVDALEERRFGDPFDPRYEN
jgi:nucleoside-diphosphate-sugar epimerase